MTVMELYEWAPKNSVADNHIGIYTFDGILVDLEERDIDNSFKGYIFLDPKDVEEKD